MKIELEDKEIAKQIAEFCYNTAYDEFRQGIYEYGGIYGVLEAKISKLIDDNKDNIISRAIEIATQKIQKSVGVMALLTALKENK